MNLASGEVEGARCLGQGSSRSEDVIDKDARQRPHLGSATRRYVHGPSDLPGPRSATEPFLATSQGER